MAVAFNNPKQIKKWKPGSSNVPRKQSSEEVVEKLKEFGKEVFKVNINNAQRNPHRQIEYARVTGRRLIFMNQDGHLFDEAAQPTTYENDGTAIIVKVDYEGNFI